MTAESKERRGKATHYFSKLKINSFNTVAWFYFIFNLKAYRLHRLGHSVLNTVHFHDSEEVKGGRCSL